MHTCFQSCQSRSKGQELVCLTPALKPHPHDIDYNTPLNYTIVVDNASGPDPTKFFLQLILKPDPTFTGIDETDTMHPINDNITSIQIRVRTAPNRVHKLHHLSCQHVCTYISKQTYISFSLYTNVISFVMNAVVSMRDARASLGFCNVMEGAQLHARTGIAFCTAVHAVMSFNNL